MPKKVLKNKGLSAPFCIDSRGEIRRYNFKGAKFNVLFTKAGKYRSGDFHPVIQYDLILKGKYQITFRKGNKNIVFTKGENELIIIPPNTPHLFKSLTDTVMLEWWDGPFEVGYYQPYRKIVERQFTPYPRNAPRSAGFKKKK
ncbi:MAG: hypothetical protein PHZ04_03130 [Patescibacteria group bacterium]|nr:hypothetical protein [Patescibacteria group bacterium]MDD5294754.1 hypothetical protein [Patescibacteria group bacterium]MDD5554695.1 hypothetical protein [Patescibacteria group bacterium]